MRTTAAITGGRNIAKKVAPHSWDETVSFCRDVVGLKVNEHSPSSRKSAFRDWL